MTELLAFYVSRMHTMISETRCSPEFMLQFKLEGSLTLSKYLFSAMSIRGST